LAGGFDMQGFMMDKKHILLIVSGGIAAYKSLELIRRLREVNFSVTCILTKGGSQFVTPLSLAALSENPVYAELFSLNDETDMGHIQLSRAADLIVVCPASADILAKMAAGLADDLASTVLLATDKPVMVVPAMNVRMWHHKSTQRNIAQLKSDGIVFAGPVEGAMACGEFGLGRLLDVPEIIHCITAHFSDGALHGKHILITAGPTHEPIDPVRYIANRSSGKQGFAIAEAAARAGARVTLVSGPVALETPHGVTRINVETAQEMLNACEKSLPADIAICVAAVADWRVDAAAQKLKKSALGLPILNFTENPDILATLSQLPKSTRPKLVIGFAAETNDVSDYAEAKRARKGCDWIVANDVSNTSDIQGGVMGSDMTSVILIDGTHKYEWSQMAKKDVAEKLIERIIVHDKN
jgi:phosphopantothenoylcysteine decarboxylase / phosphopantothenate---cysteine ligase